MIFTTERSGKCLRAGVVLWCVWAAVASWAGADRSGAYPGWLPEGEVSAFFPDDAYIIQPPTQRQQCYLRTSFDLAAAPRRAVVAATAQHLVAVVLNGKLVLENYAADPVKVARFADVTDALRPGTNTLELRTRTEWSVLAYAQLRIEGADGTFQDVSTDASWEWRAADGPEWPRDEAPADGWQPVSVLDDYYGSQGRATRWDKEFALMPRDLLTQRMEAFSGPLRAAWPQDRLARKAPFSGAYTDPGYEAQYAGFLRVDPATGQAVDATGRIRHLFFNIYGQVLSGNTALSIWDMDFDRVEEDLALMERGGVHPYLRFLGWETLLDRDGNWRPLTKQPAGTGLPAFSYNYEVLDYFIDRCQAHGRFLAIEGDFFWNAHWDTLPAPYHTRYHLYPEVAEANALAHRKILARYSETPCVAVYMIGEEDIVMDRDIENGHARQAFQAYLESRHGTLDGLRQAWTQGYDFADTSAWVAISRRPQYWASAPHDNPLEHVYYPEYPLKPDLWSAVSDWSAIDLPVWPRYRGADPPRPELMSHLFFMDNTDDDPQWIDYNALLQDVMYLDFVSRWATVVRDAAPNQLLFHCNPQDFTAHWHFFDFHRNAELPFDIIGVGSHDSGYNLADLPPWERLRKYYSVIASYRPYARAQGTVATGIASGEGEGGRPGDDQGALDYYRGQSIEMVGHGAAFELSYAWPHLSDAAHGPDGRSRFTPALQWMGEFYRQVDGKSFSLAREVPVLIVRNSHLQWSNRSGRDYGNALGLAAHLAQLNVEFDIAMDLDLVYGAQDRKIDLANYSTVFLPSIECDYPEAFWSALDEWLSDPAAAGRRTLILGWIANRSPYLAPTGRFHPVAARWVGADGYAEAVRLVNRQAMTWHPPADDGEPRAVTLNFGNRDITDTGVFDHGTPLLTLADGRAVGIMQPYAGNRVCAFGFPLGLAFDYLWGMPQQQDPYNVLAAMYEDVIDAFGTPRPVRAPHNVRAVVSDDGSTLLVREMEGIATDATIRVEVPGTDGGAPQVIEVNVSLEPYGGAGVSRDEWHPEPALKSAGRWGVALPMAGILVLGPWLIRWCR